MDNEQRKYEAMLREQERNAREREDQHLREVEALERQNREREARDAQMRADRERNIADGLRDRRGW